MNGSESQINQLIKQLHPILGIEEIDPDTSLSAIGIDSINVVELILICEQIYTNFDPASLTLDEHTTLRDLHNQLTVGANVC
jgi:acyl carrier protein